MLFTTVCAADCKAAGMEFFMKTKKSRRLLVFLVTAAMLIGGVLPTTALADTAADQGSSIEKSDAAGAASDSKEAGSKYLTADNLSVYAIKANKETSSISLSYESESATFSGMLSQYTDTEINDTDIKVEIKGLPEGAKATLTNESGEKIADFADGAAATENGAVKKEGDHTFGITVEVGEETEKCTLKLGKNIPVYWSGLAFSATPEFSADNVYYDQPEGTLFQLDDNGDRTGKTGVAAYCRNYEVHFSTKTAAIKFKGNDFIELMYSFDNGDWDYVSAIYANGELIAQDTRLNLLSNKLIGKEIPITNYNTEMQIITYPSYPKTDNAIITKVKFVMHGTIDAASLKEELENLDVAKLVYPDDIGYAARLGRDFSMLSEEDQAKISKELQEKITHAKEVMSVDRVPQKLELTGYPVKTVYGVGQKFSTIGVELLATYEDGSTRTLTSTEDYTYESNDKLTLDDKTITFTYNTAKVSIDITVRSTDKLNLEGSGTESDPYKLSSTSDMTELSEYVAAGGKTEGMFFVMTNDITLPEEWTPIGVTNDGSVKIKSGKNFTPFSGSLDGQNHTLTVPKGGLPLLGYVKEAEVKNLNIYGEEIASYGLVNNFEGVGLSGSAIVIDNVTLKSGTKTLKSGLLGGNITTNGFAGNSAGFVATVKNCTIEEGVVIGYDGEQSLIGGFAGRMQGTIENCVNYGTVKGKNYVGGIIGTRDNAMGACTVEGCRFYGVVEASGDNAGGIVGGGYSNSTAPNGVKVTVKNCESKGTIAGQNNVGGILGGDVYVAQAWNEYEFTGNSFAGTVSGKSNVGGVIGFYDSLNKFDNISGNTYTLDCGAEDWIGAVKYVDTNYENPTAKGETLYFSTENDTSACPEVTGCGWKTAHNRTDDPLGADAEKLAKGVESDKMIAAKVDEMIEAIDMTASDKAEQVAEARAAYDALTEAQQKLVNNISKLNEYEQQLTDEEKAEEVEKLIEALPAASDITVNDGDAVKAARAAYDSLTDNQKKFVSDESVSKLEAAEAAYEKAVKESQKGTGDDTKGSTQNSADGSAYQTGDDADMALWIALMLLAGSAAAGTTFAARKRRYNR